MLQNKNAATFNTSVLAAKLEQHFTFGVVACTTVSEVHTGNHFVKIKRIKAGVWCVYVCVEIHIKVWSPWGGMFFFLMKQLFFQQRIPEKQRSFKARKNERNLLALQVILQFRQRKENKKEINVIRFFFCLWLITLNGINIICFHMIFNMKSQRIKNCKAA